jgi:hypothetical protein
MSIDDAALDDLLARVVPTGAGRPLATIWATVDRERAAASLGADGDELAGDEHLGAYVVLFRGAGDEPPIALVEPSTEGRLAATLARRGEGPVGRYVAIDDAAVWAGLGQRAAAAGLAISRTAPGPFGPSRLIGGGDVFGPHLVLVDGRAGTIGR